MRRRILSIILITMTIFFVTGCGAKGIRTEVSSDKSEGLGVESKASDVGEASIISKDTVDTGESVSSSDSEGLADIADSDAATSSTSSDLMETVDTAKTDAPVEPGDPVDPVDPVEPGDPVAPVDPNNITAGLLTAGEWSDNDNWMFFTNLIADGQLSIPSFEMNPMNRIMVTVLSKEGSPVTNARVELISNSQEVIWQGVSNHNGVSYVFFNLLNDNQVPGSLRISKNGVTTNADFVLETTNNEQNSNDQQNSNNQSKYQTYQDVTVTIDDNSNTKSLDLMFVFDTTGSMGDELSYLQVEFEDIAKKVADQNTRYSVNFYRDEGDEYVVKPNEFTSDTELVLSQLNKEAADGGGDTPEAVDQALYNGIYDHDWNAESVKLLFLILDAPPHSQNPQINDTLHKSIIEAAKQGIRIIPVASSGVDKETETFLRTIAIATGGTYTFLTDDSGIGNSHTEPTVGKYEVENLNDCIVRIIKTYYQ